MTLKQQLLNLGFKPSRVQRQRNKRPKRDELRHFDDVAEMATTGNGTYLARAAEAALADLLRTA